jgi:amino acid transporter
MMALIGLCYAEAATMFPVSGGELVYAYAGFGPRAAFVVGWALALMYVSVVAYVCLSMAWIIDVLVPGLKGPPLYSFQGETIYLGGLLVAAGTGLVLFFTNYRGIRSSGRFQDLFTYGKIAIAVVFIGIGLAWGSPANLTPLFQTADGGTPFSSVVAVLAIVPWFFGGFGTAPQAMEERSPDTPLHLVGRMTVLTILAAALFYVLAILAASMSVPWQRLITLDLPVATAFREAYGSILLERLVLLTGLFGVATVGNAGFLCATRVLFAMARGRLVAPGLARTNPVSGAPDRAVLLVGGSSLLLVFAGRQGIGPIVAVGATCFAVAYCYTCAAVLRLRRSQPTLARPYRIPAGRAVALAATLGSVGLLIASIWQPFADAGGRIPLEMTVLAVWAAVGGLAWWHGRATRASLSEADRQRTMLGGGGVG